MTLSYMSTKIGIRELSRETGRYAKRAGCGETIEVSFNGRVIAMLVPAMADPWEQMIASGRILAPKRAGRLTDEGPVDFGVNATALLEANRGG
jgi:antitoxin (DNA-binding transcriptional repressor) of toxin-antitoxin stability system